MPPAFEVLLLNTTIPQIQAAQSGDTYVVPRDIAINATATITGNLGIGVATPGAVLDVSGSAFSRIVNTTAPTLDNSTHAGEALYLRSGGTAGSGNVQAVLAFGKADGSSVRSGSAIASVQTTADADQVGLGFYVSTSAASTQTMAQAVLIDSSGNLGIGTSSPVTKLQVGTVGSTGASAATNQLFGDYSTAAQLRVMLNNTGNYIGIGTDGGANLIFGTSAVNAGTSPTALATLTSSGNLGIGITNPTAKLDMASGAGAAVNAIRVRSLSTNTNGFNIVTDSVGDSIFLNNFYNAAMLFGTNNTERARITSGGNFGIGTNNPDEKFVVSSTTAAGYTTSCFDNTATNGFVQIQLRIGAAGGSGLAVVSYAPGAFFAIGPTSNDTTTPIVFRTSNSTERARIAPNGELLVGGTTGFFNKSGAAAFYNATGAGLALVRDDATIVADEMLGTLEFGGVDPALNNNAWIRAYAAGTYASGDTPSYLAFGTTPSGSTTISERARITSGGNLKLGGTVDRATTAGTNHLDIFNGTAPVGTLTNGISIYSSSGEAYVMDAAGNATLFSPHDAETNEWIFKSKHTPTGKVLKIDVERLLKFVNDHFGLDAVHEFVEE